MKEETNPNPDMEKITVLEAGDVVTRYPYLIETESQSRGPRMRLRDQALVARYYLRGHTQPGIALRVAEHTGYILAQSTISGDLARIKRLWLESSIRDFDLAKEIELRRLDQLESEYWDGWQSSKEAAVVQVQNKTNDAYTSADDKKKSGYERDHTVTKTTQRDGDPKFLQGIERCIVLRMKILGLESPKRVKVEQDWKILAAETGIPENTLATEYEKMVQNAHNLLASGGDSEGTD